MTDKRAIGSFIATGALLVLLATPVAAGQVCSVQATVDGGTATVVTVGEEVLIDGFGFFPGDVLVEYSVDAAPLTSVTVTADATGAFTTTITPAAGEEGPWTVEATDFNKGQCTDTTGFEVVGVPATPTPTPAPPATPTPTPVPPAAELPNVATSPPTPTPPLLLIGAAILALSAVMLTRRRLSR